MIPVYEPYLNNIDRKYLCDAFDSSFISSRGEFIDLFKSGLEQYIGGNGFVSLTSNGTTALHLALIALDIGPGDKVIVPDFTYVASINAILYVGAEPIIVDVSSETWLVDVFSIDKDILDTAKAIILVDIYGNPSLNKKILDYLKLFNLIIVQDCAESLGSFVDDSHTGTLADVSTFSFFGNKTITTGEGGAVWTNNRTIFEKIEKIKSQSVRSGSRYFHDEIGYNYRMTNLQAAIGCAQLEQIDTILSLKRDLFSKYQKTLINYDAQFQKIQPNSVSSYWMVGAIFDADTILKLTAYLNLNGIETRPFFSPVSTFDHIKSNTKIITGNVSRRLSIDGILFPSFPRLIENNSIDYILHHIDEFFRR